MINELVFHLIFIIIENWLNLILNQTFLCSFYIILSFKSFTIELISLITIKINNLSPLLLIVSLTMSINSLSSWQSTPPDHHFITRIIYSKGNMYAPPLFLNSSIPLHVCSIWANNINQYPAPVCYHSEYPCSLFQWLSYTSVPHSSYLTCPSICSANCWYKMNFY